MVIGTCHSLDLLDPAVHRTGRLDVHLTIPSPDRAARAAILTTKLANVPGCETLRASPEFESVVLGTDGASGADLDGICREAALLGLRESIDIAALEPRHLSAALYAWQRRGGRYEQQAK
jgi:transitional endoplasmic reticulum ATPase